MTNRKPGRGGDEQDVLRRAHERLKAAILKVVKTHPTAKRAMAALLKALGLRE